MLSYTGNVSMGVKAEFAAGVSLFSGQRADIGEGRRDKFVVICFYINRDNGKGFDTFRSFVCKIITILPDFALPSSKVTTESDSGLLRLLHKLVDDGSFPEMAEITAV